MQTTCYHSTKENMNMNNIVLGKYDTSIGDYCGITALMLLTDLRREPLKAVFNEIRGRRPTAPVMGVYGSEMTTALEKLQLQPMKVRLHKTKRVCEVADDVIAIMTVANHYIACHKGQIADTFEWAWRPVEQSMHKNRFIKTMWILG